MSRYDEGRVTDETLARLVNEVVRRKSERGKDFTAGFGGGQSHVNHVDRVPGCTVTSRQLSTA